MHRFTQGLTLMGIVQDPIDVAHAAFIVECDSGDRFTVYVTVRTSFQVMRNLDNLDNDRVPDPPNFDQSSPSQLVEKYIARGQLVTVQGIYQITDGNPRFDARTVYLSSSVKDQYLFEETHWWLTQTDRLADQWLDSLFGDKRSYELDDFVKLYRTNLNILGLPTSDDTQECAVLSRLIYGFSAAYLLNGDERYRAAAAAGVRFQRDAFRSLSHDGQYCFWAYGRRRGPYGTELLVPSQSGDDLNSIPLYEQIYALAGLTLYYRISMDWEVLEDIRRTIKSFDDFYLDEYRENDSAFKGNGGYFSHIDYATMRPDKNLNPANNLKKNWNSVGDHIPAYLINLLLALDPLPQGRQDLDGLLDTCHAMLRRVVTLILEKFPDPNPHIPYVNERFYADWTPDHSYSWQQNRAIIGHNFKIAWNLTRVAHWYDTLAARTRAQGSSEEANQCMDLARRCIALADRLGRSMTDLGIDHIRGGCFDAVEREPSNAQPVEFTWMNTKDFWQQEQAILAYLILYGRLGREHPRYLELARRTEAFWNIFFLDREHRGMFFRVTDNGLPILDTSYGVRGGHSDASGYHCFELNYLAHIYNRTYVAPSLEKKVDATFCLYFRPDRDSGMRSINVLPDFVAPGSLRVKRIAVNGVARQHFDPNCFQIDLLDNDLGCSIVVEFEAVQVAGTMPPSPLGLGTPNN